MKVVEVRNVTRNAFHRHISRLDIVEERISPTDRSTEITKIEAKREKSIWYKKENAVIGQKQMVYYMCVTRMPKH